MTGRGPRPRNRVRRAAALTCLTALLAVAASYGGQAPDPYRSVAQVRGLVCGRDMLASALAVGPGLLVTSAHNVAGSQGGLAVRFEDGADLPAEVAGMDFDRDLALLSAPVRDRPVPGFAPVREGGTGRIIRLLPQGERAEIPFTDAELVRAVGRDIYDQRNDVPWYNTRVRASSGGAGYSGAPILNERNAVIGLVYAKARFVEHFYAAAASEVEAFIARMGDPAGLSPADTGECPP